MPSLFKTAARYQNFLREANFSALAQVKRIYEAAKQLHSTLDLWLSAVEYEPMVESPMEDLLTTAKKMYWTATQDGLSRSAHAGFLRYLFDLVDEISEAKLSAPLDPSASRAMQAFRDLLSGSTPVEIAAPTAKLVQPSSETPLTEYDSDPESPNFYLRNQSPSSV